MKHLAHFHFSLLCCIIIAQEVVIHNYFLHCSVRDSHNTVLNKLAKRPRIELYCLKGELAIAATMHWWAKISSSHAWILSNKIMLDMELSGTDDASFDHTKEFCTWIIDLHLNLFWQNVFWSIILFYYSPNHLWHFLQLSSHVILG